MCRPRYRCHVPSNQRSFASLQRLSPPHPGSGLSGRMSPSAGLRSSMASFVAALLCAPMSAAASLAACCGCGCGGVAGGGAPGSALVRAGFTSSAPRASRLSPEPITCLVPEHDLSFYGLTMRFGSGRPQGPSLVVAPTWSHAPTAHPRTSFLLARPSSTC